MMSQLTLYSCAAAAADNSDNDAIVATDNNDVEVHVMTTLTARRWLVVVAGAPTDVITVAMASVSNASVLFTAQVNTIERMSHCFAAKSL